MQVQTRLRSRDLSSIPMAEAEEKARLKTGKEKKISSGLPLYNNSASKGIL